MRISDWSSDVCSSDLTFLPVFDNHADQAPTSRIEVAPLPPGDAPESAFDDRAALLTHPDFDRLADISADEAAARDPGFDAWLAAGARAPVIDPRGDEVACVVGGLGRAWCGGRGGKGEK